MAQEAAGLPSRGCPTEPSTASHCLPGSSCTETPLVGVKAVIFPVADREYNAGLWMCPQKVTWADVALMLRAASAASTTYFQLCGLLASACTNSWSSASRVSGKLA